MSGPSEKAIEAALAATRYGPPPETAADWDAEVRAHLAAAHDPALGIDRSVCLRDVVAAIRDTPRSTEASLDAVADHIEREFGGGA